MANALPLAEFFSSPGTLIDVRSPGEFYHGRIPDAFNLPLFDDSERAEIGTLYKQAGRQEAIDRGLRLVGPKLADLALTARQQALNGFVRVYCWRGGMRSASMAWLLQTSGLQVVTLSGGYKAFRRWVLEEVAKPFRLKVLGGLTGAGKTSILHALRALGEQVIDLEGIAQHRGSSYGMFGMPSQPSIEQFENAFAVQLAGCDPTRCIWVEDESHLIGTCKIPDLFFKQMRQAPLFLIERPLEERLENLLKDYGQMPAIECSQATKRIAKRLGAVRTQEVLEHTASGRMREAISLVLSYYDAAYRHGLTKRQQPIQVFEKERLSSDAWAALLKGAEMGT